ncbi:ATP-dependent helicase [uncultured Xanthomonas sp.]|uniref:ATP-dependent helicase n=1 Tax=uncultured Xanthomonas sp. TaxID=152831 RepID=UPI0025F227C9|nr:ATP-dependent helicase [uncultured Xanthomonas sp.]
MDGIELGRREAAGLHDELVASGVDPWNLRALVQAGAARKLLDIEEAGKGAAALGGARAALIPGASLILHEPCETDFDFAFLVAHELGHAELGDDICEGEPTIFDPLRPAESTAIGLDRVVDYGRRQRREVQMDLFARELLFPRPWIRARHIVDGLTARDIANRMGAPFEVVAQQLLDALLLPVVPDEAVKDTEERPLNAGQRAAAQHKDGSYLLEAGPGTGKTRTLVGRVEYLLGEGVDPRRILVLTFSNKAAGELAARIARLNAEAAAAIWIGTFHAFGLDLVRRFHLEMGLPSDPRLLDRTEAVEVVENEVPRLGLVHYRNLYDPTDVIAAILSAISRAKDEVVDDVDYRALAEAMRATAAGDQAKVEAAEKSLEVAKVYEFYERIKREKEAVDFGDLVLRPVQLLEGNEAVRRTLQETYDHILVDEYQDVNRSSVRLLTALTGEHGHVWAVGDARQSIYRFRGASSYNLDRFGREDFPGGTRGRLSENYRSFGKLLTSSSRFATEMVVAPNGGALTPTRGEGEHRPQMRRVQTGPQEIVAVADAIEEMRAEGYAYREQVVLCTGNEKLANHGWALERLGIPVLFLGSLFERDEVKDMLSLVSLLVDRRAMGLLRLGCLPQFPMALADVACVIQHAREHELEPGQWRDASVDFPSMSDGGRLALAAVAALLDGFGADSDPWQVIATALLDRTRLAAEISQSVEIQDRARGIGIWQLMNFLRVQPRGQGLPITRALERIRRLVRLGDDRDLRQLPAAAQHLDAVRIMTIHGAKGLEFPVVHLPGMNVSTLPRAFQTPKCSPPDGMVEGAQGSSHEEQRREHEKEQECLFYVAITRARDRLFFYAASVNAVGSRRNLSPFVERIAATIDSPSIKISRAAPENPTEDLVEVVRPAGMTVEGFDVGLYDRCPRRYFYMRLLQIGGKRIQTPFMQMHDAVRSAVQACAENGQVGSEFISERISESFAASGLADHGYAGDYRGLAQGMVEFFAASRADHTPQPPVALSVRFGEEQIVITPDEFLISPGGEQLYRRVRTGHARKDDDKDPAHVAFVLAVKEAAPGAKVEVVSLADQSVVLVEPTARQLANAREKVAKTLRDVRSGEFEAKPSTFTCPSCPAFFVCGEVPSGQLTVGR